MPRRTPQDRFSNRMADIERNYERQVARGMDPVVARAKRRQLVADARDDLAIRSGGDRSQTRADERAAESALTSVRRATRAMAALPTHTVATPTPRIEFESAAPASVSSADIAAATSGRAPEAYRNRGEAFAAARRRGDTTFTWNGRLFHTRTAEEENARSSRGSGSGSSSGRPRTTNTPTPAAAPAGRPVLEAPANTTLTPRQQARAAEYQAGFGGGRVTQARAAAARQREAERREQNRIAGVVQAAGAGNPGLLMKKGGSVKKMAKTTPAKKSIDGIAKRGKTRLSTRKK